MDITLVVFDRRSLQLSGSVYSEIDSFIDENYVSRSLQDEYSREEESGIPRDLRPEQTHSEERRYGRRPRRSASEERQSVGRTPRGAQPYPQESVRVPERSRTFEDALSGARNEKDLNKLINYPAQTFQQRLFELIDARKMSDPEVYKRANISRKVFSTIRSNVDYHPKKETAVTFAIALRLNLADAQDLLRRSGYTLTNSSRFDIIIGHCLMNGIYDIFEVNEVLFDNHQPTLGG